MICDRSCADALPYQIFALTSSRNGARLTSVNVARPRALGGTWFRSSLGQALLGPDRTGPASPACVPLGHSISSKVSSLVNRPHVI
jgi:hypothetical protein